MRRLMVELERANGCLMGLQPSDKHQLRFSHHRFGQGSRQRVLKQVAQRLGIPCRQRLTKRFQVCEHDVLAGVFDTL
jgi:hypothetical protein